MEQCFNAIGQWWDSYRNFLSSFLGDFLGDIVGAMSFVLAFVLALFGVLHVVYGVGYLLAIPFFDKKEQDLIPRKWVVLAILLDIILGIILVLFLLAAISYLIYSIHWIMFAKWDIFGVFENSHPDQLTILFSSLGTWLLFALIGIIIIIALMSKDDSKSKKNNRITNLTNLLPIK